MTAHDIQPPPDPGSFPARVTIELTNRCNLNCSFCPRRLMEKQKGDMGVDLARGIIDEIAEHAPVPIVPFFRGESLLNPHWHEILSYARKKRTGEIQFTTNASLLTPENSDKLLALQPEFVSFSLDTIDPVLYEKERKGANFQTTIENVHHFLVQKRTKSPGTTVQVSCVETRRHKSGTEKFVEFWQDKVDRVRIYIEHTTGDNPGNIVQDLPEFEKRYPCHKLFTDMVIYWNGEVAICNHDWTRLKEGQPIANVQKSSLSDIWQSDLYTSFRQKHISGTTDDIIPCRGCDHWKMYYLKSGFMGHVYQNKEIKN